ncbi:ferritin family protein [bacterium]|nr:ferritin family protein [bacterium]
MPNVDSMSLDKALAMALKSERDAEAVYLKLLSSVKNFVMKEKLRFLIQEEKKHQILLEAIFTKMFPGQKAATDEKSPYPKLTVALQEESSVLDLLETALEAEKASEEFYDAMSQEAEGKALRDLFHYLSDMEHGHYFMLKGEYDLSQQDESYFSREEFEYDMIHIGP